VKKKKVSWTWPLESQRHWGKKVFGGTLQNQTGCGPGDRMSLTGKLGEGLTGGSGAQTGAPVQPVNPMTQIE